MRTESEQLQAIYKNYFPTKIDETGDKEIHFFLIFLLHCKAF